jgi:uncharacterized protein YcaQ
VGRALALSASSARAIAIAAQGLAAARPARVTAATLRKTIDRLGVVQIDSVNILQRSHYLPLWSRLGAYDTQALDRLSHEGPRSLFEYWGHEASLLPVATQPLLRWRMARAKHTAWKSVRAIRKRRGFVARVLGEVRDRGPVRAGEIETTQPKRSGWWEWSDVKIAIEWLFWCGQVTAAKRKGFERLYDLPERVLPAEVIAAPTPREPDAIRALVAQGATAMGIATARDLRDYFRLPDQEAKTAIAELVEEGVLEPATVEGWTKPAYRHVDAKAAAIDPSRTALLSPFDSLVWFRERTQRMFGMRYRIEIYTPAPQRVYGYYVLPFLLGDALVARVDLKADRAARTLRVLATHPEPGAPRDTCEHLARELRGMAAWLGLEHVEAAPKGELGSKLASALGRR